MQLVSSAVTLAAGTEQYVCWAFPLPTASDGGPEAYPIVAIEQQMPTVALHHFALFTSADPVGFYTGDGGWGACTGDSDPNCFACETMGVNWGLVTGGGIGTPAVQFPAGTSFTLNAEVPPPAGTLPIRQLVLQEHLLNATGDPITVVPARVNLVSTTQPPSAFQQVGVLVGGTLDIDLPPGQTTSVMGECGLDAGSSPEMDNIFAVFPHMHKLGTNIQVTVTPQATGMPNVLLARTWNFGEQGLYPVAASTKAGDGVQVTCTYDNTTNATVYCGASTTDEMCFGVLFYYPASPAMTEQFCGFTP
jgi:hypothetical protein